MRINSDQSIETGVAIYERFGSWQAAREAARKDGWKYVIRSEADEDSAEQAAAAER